MRLRIPAFSRPPSQRAIPRRLGAAAVVAAVSCLQGCSFLSPKTDLALVSADRPATLAPRFTTAVFFSNDANEADIFLTDLPPERLADPSDALADANGSLLHIHLFVMPSAGSTPLDPTACNVALRFVVVSGGAVGIYSGGGFLYPSGKPSASTFGGTLAGGSLRLTRSTPDFQDLLGASLLEGPLSAARDQRGVIALRARIEALSASAKPPAGPQKASADPGSPSPAPQRPISLTTAAGPVAARVSSP